MTKEVKLMKAAHRQSVSDRMRLLAVGEKLEFEEGLAKNVRSLVSYIGKDMNRRFTTWRSKSEGKFYVLRVL